MNRLIENLAVFLGAMIFVIMLGLAFAPVLASGYHHNYITEVTEVTEVTNLNVKTSVSYSDLVTVAALTGAATGHQFMLATESLQWSISGACIDSDADDCGVSGALSQRVGDVLLTGILSGASDDRMVVISIGGTF